MSVSTRLILCPQCNHSFPTPVGTVTACPRCGKVVLIPQEPAQSTPPAIPPEHQSTLPVVCKLCNSRYYAKPFEMGKIIKCPDCHTGNMVIPLVTKKPVDPFSQPVSELPPADEPSSAAVNSYGTTGSPVAAPDDDDLKLSAAEERPQYSALSGEAEHLESYLRDMQQRGRAPVAPSTSSSTTPGVAPASGAQIAASASLAGAYAEDSFTGVGVGAQPAGPFPAVPAPPRTPPKSVKLEPAPVLQPIPTTPASQPRVESPRPNPAAAPATKLPASTPSPFPTGMESLEDQPSSPSPKKGWDKRYPFTSGVIDIFRQGQVISRWFTVTLLLAAQIFMLSIVDHRPNSDDASHLVQNLVIWVVFVFSVIPTIMAMSSITLTVFEDTANGENIISGWPEFSMVELFQGSVYILGSLAITGVPGLIVGLVFYNNLLYDDSKFSVFISLAVTSAFIAMSCFLFFPIVFTSMLETGTFGEPISTTILKSLMAMYGRWASFYMVGSVLLAIVLATIFVTVALADYLGLGIILPAAGVLTACPIVYMRLLGRLAMLYRDYLAELEERSFANQAN